MIHFTCACGKRVRAPDESAGTRVKCPACGNVAVVPVSVAAGPVDEETAALPSVELQEPAADSPTDPATRDLNATIALPASTSGAGTHEKDRAAASAADGAGATWTLGGYRVLRELGQGGTALVYEAEDIKLERRVALKVLKPEIAKNAQHRERFLREACTAASVECDFICRIYEVGEDDGVPFIAMPFLIGTTLKAHWKQNARLPVDEVVRIGKEIAEGLSVAHEAGLVHRDIKPANIWLETQPSGPPRAIILDFGLARIQADNIHITQSGVIVGTPAFMSPEQARGEKGVDARTDLFSLGCVLYALCTGELPFQGKQMMDVLLALATHEPPPPHTLVPAIPRPLSDLIVRLLAKQPADRPRTARAVIDQLGAMEAGLVKPATITARVKPTVRSASRTAQMRRAADKTTIVTQEMVPGTAPGARRRKTSYALYTLIAAGLLGCVSALAGGGIYYYVVTDTGTVEIRTDEAVVRVSLLKDGEEVEILDAAVKKTWPIRAGTYTLRLKDEPRDVEIVMPDRFELERGGKHVVTIRKIEAPVAAVDRSFSDADVKRIAALPAAQQVEEVRRELQKRNPGFDGKLMPKIAGNAVTGLQFTTNQVVDIAPLRALTRLQHLDMRGAAGNAGSLADLTPLRGMSLITLRLDFNPVRDLSPLQGVPLKELDLMHTEVTDLAPLKGMPLERLMLWGWRGTDLTALKGLPLRWLNCGGGRRWIDLRPLAGSALEFLCINQTEVSNLAPLKDVPLKQLLISESRVTNLDPLRAMRLEQLDMVKCKVKNLAPLERMPLRILDIKGTAVTHLLPLRQLPLKQLACDFQPKRDTRFLLPIKTLETINQVPADRFWREVAFAPRLAPMLRGEDQPATDAERLAFARYASDQKKYGFAVRLWTEALTNDPTLGDDREAQHRVHAARAAILAAAGQGDGEPLLGELAKAKLRGQALDWLNAEATAYLNQGPPESRPTQVAQLMAWRKDATLAGIRDATALAKLPAREQGQWQALWTRVPDVRPVVPTSRDEGQTWRYTTTRPADGWQQVEFDDKQWQQGAGGFGSKDSPAVVRTEWKTDDLWLRREFTLPEGKPDDLLLHVNHDDDAEVYINGVLALKVVNWSAGNYEAWPLSGAARAALKPGNNVIAVHCHNRVGMQYIDVGLVAPQGNAARLTFAPIVRDHKQFAFAARLWAAALADDPKLGDDRAALYREHGVRAAALAAAGRGDDGPLDDGAKTTLRGQALDWLKAELAARNREPSHLAAVQALWRWQQDGDLAGIRDPAALAKLPPPEQKAFIQFWADVARAEQPGNDAERRELAQIAGDRLMDADAQQFAFYVARLRNCGEQGLRVLTTELDRKPLPPAHSDWTVRFYKWEKATDRGVPADWHSVLKSPVLDELRMPRLHLIDLTLAAKTPPTPKVPTFNFAVVATAEVSLGGGEYAITTTSDDGVRVWLGNEVVLEDWTPHFPTTKSVTIRNKRGKHLIKVEFFQGIGQYQLDVDFALAEEPLAQRQANAAVALLRLGQPDKVWPLLKQTLDPRVRSYLIHRLGRLGVDAGVVVTQLDKESDPAIRRALVLSLGDFTDEDLPPAQRKVLVPKLQEIHRKASDPGLHAAAEWLLRQWNEAAWLKEIDQALAADRPQQAKRLEDVTHALKQESGKGAAGWYVNGQGQTFAVIPGPVEFWMGSPPAEPGRDGGPAGTTELRHWRRIGRSFAVASKEVTLEQFLRFRKDHPADRKAAPTADCPANRVTWYDAVAYCNWLSAQEGIPPEQWCYVPNQDGEYAQGMKLAANYLQRTGYRLPTEAEWEYACRAGTITRYSFGESDELMPKYGWNSQNAQDRSWPVGSLRPNDFGLFDMHGNDWEWCQDELKPYAGRGGGKATEDLDDATEITNGKNRVLRGGVYIDAPWNLRSAIRGINGPTDGRVYYGFRPVRTLAFSAFDRYAAARAAVLTVSGRGKDPPPPDDAMKAQLRRQALDWLKAERTEWSTAQPPRLFVARRLWQWQRDGDLAGIRDQAALAKLPAEEQKRFAQFWADVAKTAEPQDSNERLEFAGLALQIAAGDGKNEPSLDDGPKAKLRGQALAWLKAELATATDRAGKARIIAVAAALDGALDKLAESVPHDGPFHTELARHFAERGNKPLAEAARGKACALFEAGLAKEPANATLAAELADALLIDTRWIVLKPVAMKTAAGATLTLEPDGSIFVSGKFQNKETYTLDFSNIPGKVRALRLEALRDDRLPAGGPGTYPGGNFVLSRLAVFRPDEKKTAAKKLIPLRAVFATFEEAPSRSAESSLTGGDNDSGWSISPREGKSHNAIFALDAETARNDTARLEIVLDFYHHVQALLGRFRVSVSVDDPEAIVREQRKQLAATQITDPWLRLATAYALIGRNDKAAESLGKALQADPTLGDDREARRRYHAARAAIQVATGQRRDAPPLDDAAKAKRRREALDWLTAEVETWTKLFATAPSQDRPVVLAKRTTWHEDSDLAGVRDMAAMARLPADEQKQWRALWARVPDLRPMVPTATEQGPKWRYTTQRPANGWQQTDFDDRHWQQGAGVFGSQDYAIHAGNRGYAVRTEWKTDDIWLRREFTVPDGELDNLVLQIDHDDDAEIYINGVLALKLPGFAMGVQAPLSAEARAAMQPGKNVIAVHCHNSAGPQYIDVRIVAVKNNAARLAVGQLAYDGKRFAFAAQLWAEALASDPKLADDRHKEHRYHAARAAALATAGRGWGEPPLDDTVKAKLRGQALDWLKAEFAVWSAAPDGGPAQDRTALLQTLNDWRMDPSLAGIRDRAMLANLPADEQKAFTRLWADVAALLAKKAEQALARRPDDAAAADALAGLIVDRVEPKWRVLTPLSVNSEGGATLIVQPDASVLAGGVNPDKDVYVIEVQIEGPVRAIRLEVLPDPSLPWNGPGRADYSGNFILTDFRVMADNRAVTWSRVSADFSQEDANGKFSIAFTIDADEATGWGIYPRVAERHWAVFIPSQPVTTDGKTPLTIRLACQSGWGKHTLGRFRLSVTESDPLSYSEWFAAASTPHARLGAAYVALGDSRRAVDLLTKATAAAPKSPAADWLVLTLAHARLKETGQALKACSKAAERLKPTGAEDALRPLLREVLIAVGPDTSEGKALIDAAAGEVPAELNAFVKENPDYAGGYRERGEWFAEHGRWREAIADLTEAFRVEPNTLDGMRVGVLLLHAGDVDRYRAHCQAVLDQWASTNDNGDADRSLKTIMLLPDAKVDAKHLARLADVAVSGDKSADWFDYYLFAKGLHEYRTGKYADALATCRDSRQRAPKSAGDVQVLTGLDLTVEAMALYRSGDEASARRALADAKASVETRVPGIDGGGWTCDWLFARILYREAERLIAGKQTKVPR